MENNESNKEEAVQETSQSEVVEIKKRPIMFWYKGKLLPKEEHDKLSWEEIFEYNNLNTSPKRAAKIRTFSKLKDK